MIRDILINLSKVLSNFFLKTPFFISFFNTRSKILNTETRITKHDDLMKVVNYNFYYLHLSRSDYYIRGLKRRLEKLNDEYFLDYMSKYNCKTLIDIGANIGEVPLSIHRTYKDFKYIGVEPSIDEFNCLKMNILQNFTDYKLLNMACGELENSKIKFFISSKNADSSVVKPDENSTEVNVDQTTIDKIIFENNLNSIFLKIDAEGYEPEVLKGIKKFNKKIKFISVDCGFERGMENLSTLPSVTSILYEKNFKMIKNHKKRMTYLFENQLFSD